MRSTAYSRPRQIKFISILDIPLTFSRPATLDTEAASSSQMSLPMQTRIQPDPSLRKGRPHVHIEKMVIGVFILLSFFSPPHSSLPLSSLLTTVFTTEELESTLRPVFEVVWDQDPESYPFRHPVDPRALGIPVHELYSHIQYTNQKIR